MTRHSSLSLTMCSLVGCTVLGFASLSGFAIDTVDSESKSQPNPALTPTTQIDRSPFLIAVSPDSATAYVTDRTAGTVVVLDLKTQQVVREIAVEGKPHGVTISETGDRVYVAEHGAGTVAVIDPIAGKVIHRIAVGRWPTDLVLAKKTKRLFVANQDDHTVSIVELEPDGGKVVDQAAAIREPFALAITPDERYVFVANQLPHGVGTDSTLASEITIIDANDPQSPKSIKLSPGSSSVKGICIDPSGKWAYVVHNLGRFNLPVTQLERGWVNTTALTILDVAKGERYATLLLDDLVQGAPDPHSILCSNDGKRLWISHSAVHHISLVDIGGIHELLNGNLSDDLATLQDGNQPNIWMRIKQDPENIRQLENDLTALYIAGVIQRAASGGNGPRGIGITADETQLLVANYFSGTVTLLGAVDGIKQGEIRFAKDLSPSSLARRGEILFHDAGIAFQNWLSCASCHPNDGRTDALRWDFLRDGIGNPKDTPSLILARETEPMNRRATRETVRQCARTGVMVSHRLVPTEAEVDALEAYLLSLDPEPNPFLGVDGELSEAAQRGKVIFNTKAACAYCHPAPYYTDNKMHNVGVLSHLEPDGMYDTPTLIELHRTAPYLHDGRALTIKEVLTVHDQQGQHGKLRDLSEAEIDDLVEFLRSL